ncbi:transcriptional repressor [Microbacterium sp. LRZ72]|uniref:Fur family transcriptional regulator n=1 Tax=Microbacterium sp. LRZ72 TaxID=2942481 RepID=UPI0029A37992|nr:Fur family transcriptional regulator [Microbacterium sp. LRZ72]MDX2377047.1 transcriptional repressor [Microbacterium sp. LRZ72]
MTETQPENAARHESTASDASALLRHAGMRVTAQRTAVLTALAEAPHAPVDALHHAVRDRLPGIALQTVHGVVNDLTDAGLVRRVSLPAAPSALYELHRADDNHHHVQCVVCARVEDVDCAVGEAPCLHPSHDHGMRVLEANVTFRAICAECERNQR